MVLVVGLVLVFRDEALGTVGPIVMLVNIYQVGQMCHEVLVIFVLGL